MTTDATVGNTTCSIQIRDFQGEVLATSSISWQTNGTDYGDYPQDGTGSPPYYDDTKASSCKSSCSSAFSLTCMANEKCWSGLAEGIGYIGLIAGSIVGVLVLAKTGLLLKFGKLVLGALTCGSSGSPPKTKPIATGPPPGDAQATVTTHHNGSLPAKPPPIERHSLQLDAAPWGIPSYPATGQLPPDPGRSAATLSSRGLASGRLDQIRALDASMDAARMAFWAQQAPLPSMMTQSAASGMFYGQPQMQLQMNNSTYGLHPGSVDVSPAWMSSQTGFPANP